MFIRVLFIIFKEKNKILVLLLMNNQVKIHKIIKICS